MEKRVALLGNPNCGKSTIFNYFTRLDRPVGNRAGVTLDKKEGVCHFDKSLIFVDLPGIYSLNPIALEERTVREYLLNEKPDVVVNVLDATNLKKGLYLTTVLLEFCPSLVLVLNMCDELPEGGAQAIAARLGRVVGAPVVAVSAVKGENMDGILNAVNGTYNFPPCEKRYVGFDAETESRLNKTLPRFLQLEEYTKIPENRRKISKMRYAYVDGVLAPVKNFQNKKIAFGDKLDKIVFNKFTAFPLFFLVLFVIYFLSIQLAGNLFREAAERGLNSINSLVCKALLELNVKEWIIGLLTEGIILGVGSILTFLPQITVLFLMLTLLEGCGYMARMAALTDRIFKGLGLSGRALLPLLLGCGCTVPAVLSTNALEDPVEKETVLMVTSFVPCSAKLPVFALLAGSFFPENPFIAPSMYLIGISTAILYSFIFTSVKYSAGEGGGSFFYELPLYRLPPPKSIAVQTVKRLGGFLTKTGTTVFLASCLLWFLSHFDLGFNYTQDVNGAVIARLGGFLSPLFAPLGFGNYQTVSALITGILGKEAIVGALAVLLKNPASIAELLSPAAGYSLMVFILLSSPCAAAVGALSHELRSKKKLLFLLLLQQLTAYFAAFIAFRLLS